MSKFSLKAGANRFLLDDEHVYYAIFVKEEERDFIAERGKNKGKRFTGLNFYYEIISDRELLEGEGSSRGKQLRIFFFANGMDGDRFVFPKKGEYFAVLESMADFLGKDIEDIDDTEDLFGSVVVLAIKNDGGDGEDDVEYSNIESVRGVSDKRMDKVKQLLKEYKVWKKEQDEEEDEKPKKKKKRPVEEDDEDDTPKKKNKAKPSEDDEEDDEPKKKKSKPKDDDDEEEEEKPKKGKKKKEDDDDDDFFDE